MTATVLIVAIALGLAGGSVMLDNPVLGVLLIFAGCMAGVWVPELVA